MPQVLELAASKVADSPAFDYLGTVLVTENVLPLDRPARIGITSGASTPDSVVQVNTSVSKLVS